MDGSEWLRCIGKAALYWESLCAAASGGRGPPPHAARRAGGPAAAGNYQAQGGAAVPLRQPARVRLVS